MTTKNPRLQAMLGAGALLLIGVVLGIGVDRTLLLPRHGEARPARVDHGVVVVSLTRDLGLSQEQAEHVLEVLERHQTVVDATWADTHRALMAALDSVTNQIEAVLDSAQVERYHAWIDARHPRGDPGRPNHQPH